MRVMALLVVVAGLVSGAYWLGHRQKGGTRVIQVAAQATQPPVIQTVIVTQPAPPPVTVTVTVPVPVTQPPAPNPTRVVTQVPPPVPNPTQPPPPTIQAFSGTGNFAGKVPNNLPGLLIAAPAT